MRVSTTIELGKNKGIQYSREYAEVAGVVRSSGDCKATE